MDAIIPSSGQRARIDAHNRRESAGLREGATGDAPPAPPRRAARAGFPELAAPPTRNEWTGRPQCPRIKRGLGCKSSKRGVCAETAEPVVLEQLRPRRPWGSASVPPARSAQPEGASLDHGGGGVPPPDHGGGDGPRSSPGRGDGPGPWSLVLTGDLCEGWERLGSQKAPPRYPAGTPSCTPSRCPLPQDTLQALPLHPGSLFPRTEACLPHPSALPTRGQAFRPWSLPAPGCHSGHRPTAFGSRVHAFLLSTSMRAGDPHVLPWPCPQPAGAVSRLLSRWPHPLIVSRGGVAGQAPGRPGQAWGAGQKRLGCSAPGRCP